MKNAALVCSLVVLSAFGVGFVRSRLLRTDAGPPQLSAPTPRPDLDPLETPRGEGSLALRIVDERGGAPDVCAQLRVGPELRWGFSDASGHVRFEGLSPGEHEVAVIARDRDAISVVLASGSAEHIVALGPRHGEPRRVPAVERAPVSGRLDPILGSNFGAYEIIFQPRLSADVLGGQVPRRAVCDAGGAFGIDDLALGEYRLHVRPPWASSGSWPELIAADDASYEHVGERADLNPSVAIGIARGTVTDDRGLALEGAQVIVFSAGDPNRVWPPVASDERGQFRVRDLPPGPYVVEVRAGEGSAEIDIAIERGGLTEVRVPPIALRRPNP